MTDGSDGPPPPVGPVTTLALAASGLLLAGMVTLGLSGLLPEGDLGLGSGRSSDRGLAPVPAVAASAPELVDVAPAVAFERAGPDLPPGSLGPWEEVRGDWRAAEGRAQVEVGRDGGLAVVAAPAGTTIVQVTLAEPRSGAGVVASYRSPEDHLALVVDPSGRAVVLERVDGDAGAPVVLGQAFLQDPGEPLVLALRRDGNRVQAVANGVVVVDRVDRQRPGAERVGLVAGPGRSGQAARYDDLVVG